MIHCKEQIKSLMREPQAFAEYCSGLKLRKYQQGVMEAIVDSVLNERGFSFVILFPRQSGKNELQAHLEVYLLTLFSQHSVELIKVSPTLEPQGQISMARFEKVMRQNKLVRKMWKKEGENAFRMAGARISFLSAAAGSNIVGATASGLLEVDEAQQVSIMKFDRDVSPMAASTCATHVFWGTAWTRDTLLGREMRAAQAAEKADGIRRVFRLTANDVSAEVPEYKKFVEDKVARHGRNHPMIRTQYFSEEIDSAGAMFTAERLKKMRPRKWAEAHLGAEPSPAPTTATALLLDVAGEDEGVRSMTGELSMANPARDATALTLVEIVMEDESNLDEESVMGMVGHPSIFSGSENKPSNTANKVLDTCERPTLREVDGGPTLRGVEGHPTLPKYRVMRRWQWVGVKHTELHERIREIALEWKVRVLVADATGVGAGLASFLDRALPGRVIPFSFNNSSKSNLGWGFLEVVDAGRWQEPIFEDLPGDDQAHYQKEFFAQLAACQFQVSNDSKHSMSWGVTDGSRDPASGEPLHDDWIISAALCALLEKQDWRAPAEAFIVQAADPLKEMDEGF